MDWLVIRPGALGDLLLTLPALEGIRTAAPGGRIEVLARGEGRHLLGPPLVDAVGWIESAGFAPLFGRAPLPGGLRERLGSASAAIAYLPDPDGRVAGNLGACGISRVEVFDPLAAARRDAAEGRRRHVSEILGEPLRRLGVPIASGSPRLALRPPPAPGPAGEVPGAPRPWIGIHPGSGTEAKCAPAGLFADLARRVRDALGGTPVFLQGPDPPDRLQVGRIVDRLEPWIPPVLGPLPILEFAARLLSLDAYVGCDSGATHLAGLLGVPAVAIFGPTDPAVWGPLGPSVRTLGGPPAGFPGAGAEGILGEVRGLLRGAAAPRAGEGARA